MPSKMHNAMLSFVQKVTPCANFIKRGTDRAYRVRYRFHHAGRHRLTAFDLPRLPSWVCSRKVQRGWLRCSGYRRTRDEAVLPRSRRRCFHCTLLGCIARTNQLVTCSGRRWCRIESRYVSCFVCMGSMACCSGPCGWRAAVLQYDAVPVFNH